MRQNSLSFLGLSLIAALAAGAAAQEPATVHTAPVVQRELQWREVVTGSLRAAREVALAALEDGALVELNVREGAAVQKGQVLARTDSRRIDADLLATEAELRRVQAEREQLTADLANAEADEAAVEAAAAERAASQRELRNARTRVQVARSALSVNDSRAAVLAARLQQLTVRQKDTVLSAPFDGVVIMRHTEPGAWRRAGDPVLTVQSTGVVEAWLDVPERFVRALAAADESDLEVHADALASAFAAKRVRLLPRVHERARTFTLVVDLEHRDLMPGMSVSAALPIGPMAPHFLVPRNALVRRPGLTSVYVVTTGPQGKVARMVPVVEQFATREGIAVTGGESLVEGADVVVEGNERLFDGAPVLASPANDHAQRAANGAQTGGR